MRVIFGVLSLLIVVAIVGVLAKKQLSSIAPVSGPPPAAAPGTMATPTGTPQQQVQQFQKAVQGAVDQQPRQMPDEPK